MSGPQVSGSQKGVQKGGPGTPKRGVLGAPDLGGPGTPLLIDHFLVRADDRMLGVIRGDLTCILRGQTPKKP